MAQCGDSLRMILPQVLLFVSVNDVDAFWENNQLTEVKLFIKFKRVFYCLQFSKSS